MTLPHALRTGITRRRLFGFIPLPLFLTLASAHAVGADQAPADTALTTALGTEARDLLAAYRAGEDRVDRAIDEHCEPPGNKRRSDDELASGRARIAEASHLWKGASSRLYWFICRIHAVPEGEWPAEPLSLTIDGILIVVGAKDRAIVVTQIGRNQVL